MAIARKILKSQVGGYLPRAFKRWLLQHCGEFRELTPGEQQKLAMILWSMSSNRYRHNSGDAELNPIPWRQKAAWFGSAARFDQINEALGWFELRLKARKGKSMAGWAVAERGRELLEAYLSGKHEPGTGLDDENGKPYRTPKDAIRSVTSTGKKTRFRRDHLPALVEVDGDRLHEFQRVADHWLYGTPCPAGYDWVIQRWQAIRDGVGPKSGPEASNWRAHCARTQAGQLYLAAVSSGAPGFMLPTTYVESDAGRLYAEGALNLQNCVGEVRRVALADCYDVDISNAHWSLVSQMAGRLDVATPMIRHYLDNKRAFRAEVALAAGISREDAKFVMLAAIYGATLARTTEAHKRAVAERIGNDAVDRLKAHGPLVALIKEVGGAGRAIIDDYACRTAKKAVLVNDAGREIALNRPPRELLAHILQGAESCALQAMMPRLEGQIRVLQHDGLTVSSKPDLAALEADIQDATSYDLRLEMTRL